jgi:hypothetical protein
LPETFTPGAASVNTKPRKSLVNGWIPTRTLMVSK